MNSKNQLEMSKIEKQLEAQLEEYFIKEQKGIKSVFVHLIKGGGSFVLIDFLRQTILNDIYITELEQKFNLKFTGISFENNRIHFDLEMEGF